MAKPEKTDNPNKAGGRETAPGLDKVVTYVNAEGNEIQVSKREWHDTYKDQGYRPANDVDDDETGEDTSVAEPTA